ncbi:glycogen/starch/alpha-glucan phosphorylase [Croceibacterium sp. TMG7-5b_MA50]|uniref:glycogen/starch/alpha-glucan phosphorylase n=1 Tax=Croceibacterium sp. TMG7-5b_MA50 TaxID=3121290 RepID=UPI0032220300
MATRHPGPLAGAIARTLLHRMGKQPAEALPRDWLDATILTVRDEIVERWVETTLATQRRALKQVNYLSLEFLVGRLLSDALRNLGRDGEVASALAELGVNLAEIEELEPDAALGNGGLGRLAACFMDSLASLGLPAFGYGIRYVNGMFRQRIDGSGQQVELPETWLAQGNPWEFERRDSVHRVGFGGAWHVVEDGRVRWSPAEYVEAIAVDMPVVGWRGRHVNTLRLWTARAIEPLRLDTFNQGDFAGALADQTRAETLVRVLYPNDSTPAGQELRLRQEYFFASASIQDIVQRHLRAHGTLATLPDKAAIQLNDTHPAIGVAELLRLLIDEHRLPYDEAWDITRRTFAYTNHTLLPEALESWPLPLLGRLLPRHLELIFRINADVLAEAQAGTGSDTAAVEAVSLIDERGERRVRMANLAFAGSHSVNGVAGLHTQLMQQTVFADLHRLYPDRINNKTNGITPRRWLLGSNPGLATLLSEAIGPAFVDDLAQVADIRPLAEDAAFRDRFAVVKQANKAALAAHVASLTGLNLDPAAMFDVQVKRIHEYKRQLLNILHTMVLYERMRAAPQLDWVPRVKLFAGKAASGYATAKQIVRLANDVARRVNADPLIAGRLQVAFLPDYNVSLAERIMPAADLSEQISTAGMEASGTGNMKLALNGALTIGTLDGANVEMREHIGADDMQIFGLTAPEVTRLRERGYDPRESLELLPELKAVLADLAAGRWSDGDQQVYASIIESLLTEDRYLLIADFATYDAAQAALDRRWSNRQEWTASAIRNVAAMGWCSSDRTIAQYAREIWRIAA